ncbi:hypothetical protein XENORESO_019137 [Xenotaenia resolanae]|uniref:Uncharacterized protein n=1 Tax=Xenotaenia resolanae TaxID=208358 RepID=A0ABV0WV85_9TELE
MPPKVKGISAADIPPVVYCTLTCGDASADRSAAPPCLFAATADMEDNPGCAAAASAVHTISGGCHPASNLIYSTLIYLPLLVWSLCSVAVKAAPPEKCLPPSGPTVVSSIAPELPASTSSTSQAEVHCSSDCCRDLAMEANRYHISNEKAFSEMLFHFKNVAALFDS